MLNDAVVNDWLVRSPFVKAKKGELIAIAHEAKRQVVLTSENEEKLLKACNTIKRRHLKAMIVAAIRYRLPFKQALIVPKTRSRFGQ
jgi:hypothetical protein